jgi:hypothetical protein
MIGEHKMLKRTIAITTACAILAFFAGCSGTAGNNPFRVETLLDQNWGRSIETAKFNQTLDPEAGKNNLPVEGLSGKPTGYAVDKYENSFKEKVVTEMSSTTSSVVK